MCRLRTLTKYFGKLFSRNPKPYFFFKQWNKFFAFWVISVNKIVIQSFEGPSNSAKAKRIKPTQLLKISFTRKAFKQKDALRHRHQGDTERTEYVKINELLHLPAAVICWWTDSRNPSKIRYSSFSWNHKDSCSIHAHCCSYLKTTAFAKIGCCDAS